VDTLAPAAPLIGGADRTQNVRQVTLSGTAEPGATIRIAEGVIVADSHGNWTTLLLNVPDGRHVYTATATDAAGNASGASAERVIVVDTVAPTVSLVGVPAALTNTRSPVVGFAADEAAGFECRVIGDWVPCASPLTLGPLIDGTYIVRVRATDSAGNTGAEVASGAFTVDATAPVTTISDTGVVSSEAGASLECRLDGGAWSPCSASYGGGAPGEHVLEARATDAADNVGSVARHRWTVTAVNAAPPPVILVPQKVTVTVARRSLATVLKRGLVVQVGCARACRATLVLAQGKKRLVRKSAAAGRVTLKLSASTRKALRRSKRVTFTLTVTAPDAAAVKKRVTLKR
jgi:hypothetical protein